MRTLSSPSYRVFAVAASFAAATLLGGCALSGTGTSAATANAVTLAGSIHGGQQPVVGATIQLYAVGTSATGAAATPLIGGAVTSDSNGGFNITGTYSCTNATQVYLVASGGNPGAGTNSYSVLAAALGNCSNLSSSTFINVDELTTVAAAYTLAPFEGASYTSIGANTGTAPGNIGLPNAFGTAALLVDTNSGIETANLPAGITLPAAKLNTLADILASCVNSTGGSSAACTQLNSVTGATNTFDAAFYIAKNPGTTGVLGLYSLVNGNAPYQPANATQPKDFTLSIRYAGPSGTFNVPYGIAIDASGNAFVTNQQGGSVTAISPASPTLTTSTNSASSSGGIYSPEGIAIDTNGFFWIASTGSHNVVELSQLSTVGGTAANFSAVTSRTIGGFGTSANPTAIATDQNGNAYTSSPADTTIYAINAGSSAISGVAINASYTGVGALTLSNPSTIAIGNSAGQACTVPTNLSSLSCTQQGSATSVSALAYNPYLGNAGYAGLGTGSAANTPLYGPTLGASSTSISSTTGTAPNAIAFGTGGTAYIAFGSGLYVYNGTTAISPASGFSTLSTPQGVAVDPSGNVWTTNSGNNSVSIFVGLATPTITPIAANLH